MKTAAAFALLCLFASTAAITGEPPAPPEKPEPPKRPFPALPAVIWYEDFEIEPSHFEKGKVGPNPVPQMKNNNCMELTEQDKNNKQIWTIFKPLMVAAKFPDGTNPAHISFYMNVWVEVPGDFTIKAFHKGGDYQDKVIVSKEKTWVPVSIKIADMRNKNNRAEPEHLIDKVEIFFAPRDKKEFKKAYIDDLIVTTGAGLKPEMLLPAVKKARQQIYDMTKSPSKDGYSFTQASLEMMKRAVKSAPPSRKNKAVVAFGPRAEDGAEIAKGLATAAGKVKLIGYTFANAEIPEMGPAGGSEEARLFVGSNIDRTSAEYALLVLGVADAKLPGRPSENVRLFVERALEVGVVPIVAIPPTVAGLSDKEKKDFEGYIMAVTNLCSNSGVTIIDSNVAIKTATNPMDGLNLTPAGLEAISSLAAGAIKHIDTHLHAKK
jgi:hypothetical protein